MTLEQWKATYYAIPADEATGSDAEALEHSLWKWIGIRGNVQIAMLGSNSCALCQRHLVPAGSVGCSACPLGKSGNQCGYMLNNSYDTFFTTNNPEPMIKALAELLDIELTKQEE